MKKETVYKIVIGLLILLNLLQVGGRFLQNRPPEDIQRKVVDQLQLDASQEKQFFALAQNHRKSMMTFNKGQHQLTQAYFAEPSEALLRQIMVLEKEKIQITEKHFTDIKAILKPDQYADFENFKKKALARILQVPPNKRPPHSNR